MYWLHTDRRNLPRRLPAQAVEFLQKHIAEGGNLLLTGQAGIYSAQLGFQKNAPVLTRPDRSQWTGFVRGRFHRKHQIFAGVSPSEIVKWPGGSLQPVACWRDGPPVGEVLAIGVMTDKSYCEEQPVIVSYLSGENPNAGSVFVMGEGSVDFKNLPDDFERLFDNLVYHLASKK